MKFKLSSLLLALTYLTACVAADPLEGRRRVELPFETKLGEQGLMAYVAETPEEQAQGLMFVRKLPQNTGMIFVYDEMGQPTFWMKNMKISLDFVYLDDEGVVVDLLENVPPCTKENDFYCERYQPQMPTQYVLEVPEGWVDEVGLQVGDQFGLEALSF